MNGSCLQIEFVVHSHKIHLKPSKFLFGCDLAYFGSFAVSILENDSKTPEFWVVGSGFVMLMLAIYADLEGKIVPVWFSVIAASLRSVKTLFVGYKII